MIRRTGILSNAARSQLALLLRTGPGLQPANRLIIYTIRINPGYSPEFANSDGTLSEVSPSLLIEGNHHSVGLKSRQDQVKIVEHRFLLAIYLG